MKHKNTLMAKYIMQEMPETWGNCKGVKYPRLVVDGQVGRREIAMRIASGTTFGAGEVEGIIISLVEVIGRYAALGYSVKLDSMGIFTASLGIKEGTEREVEGRTHRNASSIEVNGIHFRADKEFVRLANSHCALRRSKPPKYISHHSGRDERLSRARDFIRTHGGMMIREYAGLTGLSYSTASRELKLLCAEGLLSYRGRAPHGRYHLPSVLG